MQMPGNNITKFSINILVVNMKQEAEITQHELQSISKQQVMPDSVHITIFNRS